MVDGRSLVGTSSIRLHSGRDYVCGEANLYIRWTELFLLKLRGNNDDFSDTPDPMSVSSTMAKAICSGLVTYLGPLRRSGVTKIAVRVKLEQENVRNYGYI
jgi:hypothetical protein